MYNIRLHKYICVYVCASVCVVKGDPQLGSLL